MKIERKLTILPELKRGRPDLIKVDFDTLHTLWIKHEDITGYKPAMEHWGDWATYLYILNQSTELKKRIEIWNHEITTIQKSRAISTLMKASEDGNVNAAKYIAEEKWNKGKVSTTNEIASLANESKEDLEKIMEALNG